MCSELLAHNMEEQRVHETPMQLMSFAFGGNANDMSHLCQDNPNHQYVMTAGRNQVPSVPLSLSHWLQCQQTSQGYVEYLAEGGIAEIQRDMSYNNPGVAFGFQPADSSVGMDVRKEINYLMPHNEGGPMNNFPDAEYQLRVERRESNESHSRVAGAAPGFSSKPRNHISRRRASATDRIRKARIAERLDALHELLPSPKEGCKASLIDDIIDHIKYLQLQVKDLSQSRLEGESISDPFVFLEGYGHYLLHEQMYEPLEEMMGRLLEVNPSAATQLLASRGLLIMPTDLAEGLHQVDHPPENKLKCIW
ncbi:transcription factor bHLH7-like isoform X3 [Actinidia eriantha]|uniref:transcription factor bHLH7-like isoform X3 n=1 Tax=Actinidia eriantha TaxID=165200 RepID=UPI00258D6985|nr:transcription factor bHLH7-like isoform X3 [Actinidia eriantha]